MIRQDDTETKFRIHKSKRQIFFLAIFRAFMYSTCFIMLYWNFYKSFSLSCIENFSHIFNSKSISSRLKSICPKRCLTRWSNVFDICSYIITHFDSLKKFFAYKFNLILSPFQKKVKIVESCIKAVVKWAPLLYITLLLFKILVNNLVLEQE